MNDNLKYIGKRAAEGAAFGAGFGIATGIFSIICGLIVKNLVSCGDCESCDDSEATEEEA